MNGKHKTMEKHAKVTKHESLIQGVKESKSVLLSKANIILFIWEPN